MNVGVRRRRSGLAGTASHATGLERAELQLAIELHLGRQLPSRLIEDTDETKSVAVVELPAEAKPELARRLGQLLALACCGQDTLWRMTARILAQAAEGGGDAVLEGGTRHVLTGAFLDGFDELEDWRTQKVRAEKRQPRAADRRRAEDARGAARQRLERELRGVHVERHMGLRAANTLSPMLQVSVFERDPALLAKLGKRLLERKRPVSGLVELKSVLEGLGELEAPKPESAPPEMEKSGELPPDLAQAMDQLRQGCRAQGWRALVLFFSHDADKEPDEEDETVTVFFAPVEAETNPMKAKSALLPCIPAAAPSAPERERLPAESDSCRGTPSRLRCPVLGLRGQPWPNSRASTEREEFKLP